MKKTKNCICIIPARGGSKRLKNKNILKFKKKHLISHTIEHAIKANIFDLIVVTSDSKKILNICSKYKNITLHKRSKKLSNDKTTVNEVCLEVLKFYELKNFFFNFTCCLYATSPLRKEKDIKKSYKLIKESKNNFVIAVSEYNFPPHQALFKNKKYLKPLFPKLVNKKTNTTGLGSIFVDNGSTYFARTTEFIKNKSFYGNKLSGYFMKREVSIDIDTKEDFNLLKKIK
jgi:pseudaminic acid cytidylyltransferase